MKLGCGRDKIGGAVRLLHDTVEEFGGVIDRASNAIVREVVLPATDFLLGEPSEHDRNIRDYKLRK